MYNTPKRTQEEIRRTPRLSLPVSVLLACLLCSACVIYSHSTARLVHAANVTTKHFPQASTVVSALPDSLAYDGWNDALVSVGQSGTTPSLNVYNYNPTNGHRVVFVPQPPYLPLTTHIDGVSPNGYNLLYQFSQSGHTLYYTLKQLAGTGFFYELNDASAGNALWTSDSRHAFILSINNAVEDVDTQTGLSQSVVSLPIHNVNGAQTQIGRLTFVYGGYLYFVGSGGFCEGALCRIQLHANTASVQQIAFPSSNASYWLAPDGRTIYFANKQGPAGEAAVYAVNSDGSNLHVLRTFAQYPDATPIGYAANNALVIMTEKSGRFEAVKLGTTPSQDVIVWSNAAPGANTLCDSGVTQDSICDAHIAFAPYGHAMLVTGTYTNGTQKVWSDDLVTGKQFVLLSATSNVQIVLPGWDRVSVS